MTIAAPTNAATRAIVSSSPRIPCPFASNPNVRGLAQDYPVKPVRLIVPFPPGGPLDIAGRLIGQQLSEAWKQPVIVENRPGGTLGPESVVKAAPDGYTLLIISSSPLLTLPHMQKVPYDVLRDLVGVDVELLR